MLSTQMLKYLLSALKPALFLTLLLFIGSLGYHLIEDYDAIDSLYMTVITITTVGFGVIRPLSSEGKLFTIFLIVGGVIFYGVSINSIMKVILESKFRDIVEKNKMEEMIKKLTNHYIICGGGRFAWAMAKEFEKHKLPFVIIENNPESIVSKTEHKWLVVDGDALQEEVLITAGIHKARGIASVLPTDADNLFVVLSARGLNPKIRIETRVSRESVRSKMVQAGADKVISPYEVGGLQMARGLIDPDIAEFIEVLFGRKDLGLEMRIHTITNEDKVVGSRIQDTSYRKDGYIIVALKRDNADIIFAPSAKERINLGDQIFLLGSRNHSIE
ncbi:MAG: NAD-binding protein [Leptospiraceae bacterium]|nr:NAD-binding protein [Leptospiraceae bacterium]